jgi:ribonucleoside-triphosphate reductase (formate)
MKKFFFHLPFFKGGSPMFPTQTLTQISKRNGQQEDFNPQKISQALRKAGEATGEFGESMADVLMVRVVNLAHQLYSESAPTVENIQDIVEEVFDLVII